MAKRTCFIFQPIFPLFSGILAYQRPISLSPVIASTISSIVFFDDTSWSSSASGAAPLVKLSLFSSLRRFYVCTNMSFDFLSSYSFRRKVSARLHCHCKIVTWMFLDLAATSSSFIFASCFFTFFRTTWISSTLVKVTIFLSSVHVYLLLTSIGLHYFHSKKGGLFMTVTYLSVLST